MDNSVRISAIFGIFTLKSTRRTVFCKNTCDELIFGNIILYGYVGVNTVRSTGMRRDVEMSEKASRLRKKPKSQQRYLLGCSNKSRFKSLEHAKDVIGRIRNISAMESVNGQPAEYRPIRAYACGNCKGFHLSSRMDRDYISVSVAS